MDQVTVCVLNTCKLGNIKKYHKKNKEIILYSLESLINQDTIRGTFLNSGWRHAMYYKITRNRNEKLVNLGGSVTLEQLFYNKVALQTKIKHLLSGSLQKA